MRFSRGLRDGLPIALGYVPVAFAYAMGAVAQGFPAWFPILVSATNFTGTGQFAGTKLIVAGASLAVWAIAAEAAKAAASVIEVSRARFIGYPFRAIAGASIKANAATFPRFARLVKS